MEHTEQDLNPALFVKKYSLLIIIFEYKFSNDIKNFYFY